MSIRRQKSEAWNLARAPFTEPLHYTGREKRVKGGNVKSDRERKNQEKEHGEVVEKYIENSGSEKKGGRVGTEDKLKNWFEDVNGLREREIVRNRESKRKLETEERKND